MLGQSLLDDTPEPGADVINVLQGIRISVTSDGRRKSRSRFSEGKFDDDRNFSRGEIESVDNYKKAENAPLMGTAPDMWSKEYIGLYSQYAAVGLIYGSTGTLYTFCFYVFKGAANLCTNSINITTFAWSIKIFYAILTDCYRPFGMRRKPWMLFGWGGVLLLLLVLGIAADQMTASVWLVCLLLVQVFMMFSDVPADGMSVELGHMESEEERGQILATGQRVRFFFCMVAGFIQTFLLNGPKTNYDECPINFDNCWGWGLTVNQYYALMFVMVFVLCVPIYFLKELDCSHIPVHSFKQYLHETWLTMQNLTTFYLIIFVAGSGMFSYITNNVNIYLQYNVIKLTSFQAGIDTITTYLSLVFAIWLFQKFLIRKNWRITQYCSVIFSAVLGFLWFFAYWDIGGTRTPWYTIFVDLDQSFAQGIAQVLFSMAVIELSKPGQEATTYELVITVANAAKTLCSVLGTQLLAPMGASDCQEEDTADCPDNSVDTFSSTTYIDSGGPIRYSYYSLLVISIMVVSAFVFTPFLPSGIEECDAWTKQGDLLGTSVTRGKLTLLMAIIIMGYGIIASILLLDSQTSCEQAVGGTGC